ncbi:hypothetical protein [Neorhizobium sp. NCHU2750]|uniref:hypothetical protein n=1 Tax=Neorhizobium sp. NCHU2750 TaxID=1825976 RepID=UPI000E7244D2|nr:hypothetical protein NCHU2750_15370 [Neorhizobium sp. NCHU2750]
MAKVNYTLPNGYSADITAAKEAGSFDDWIDKKFGDRIRVLITEDDFTIDVQDDHFVVDFAEDDDALAFVTLIGGRIIE